MASDRFDVLVRSLQSGVSRRGVLAGLSTGLLAALPLGPGIDDADAKNKKKKGKKKKKKSPAVSPPPPPASPPPPLLPVEVRCDLLEPGHFLSNQRWAQTFLAPRAGLLGAAEVFVGDNADGLSLTFEIREVNGLGVPKNNALASEVVSGIPASGGGGVTRRISATFDPPAPVNAGQRYALVVTGPSSTAFSLTSNFSGDRCPDQTPFRDPDATGAFLDDLGDADLVFAVVIDG